MLLWLRHISISVFFLLFLFAYTLVFEGFPSPATCHVNPAPLTSSGSVDAVPLHRVNTPGIGLG